jgi:hypothetical protein
VTLNRVASLAGAVVVAAIAALASYTHMRGLALRYGQTELIANLLPLSVDGMMVVASVALGDGRRHRWSAWLAFWIGVAASVIANVLAAQPTPIARCISAWPAVAFVLVIEVITRRGREHPVTGAPAAVPTESATAPTAAESAKAPTAAASPRAVAVPRTVLAAETNDSPAPTTLRVPTAAAATPHVGRSKPLRSTPTRHESPGAPRRRRPVAETAALADQIEAATPSVTPAEVAAQLGISTSRLRAIRRDVRDRETAVAQR